eukprot:jgi/Psemu1/239115/estExt_Genewise1.C_1260016
MVSSLLTVLALLSTALQPVPVAAANDAGLSWTIYHSWNPNQQFVRRGNLVWGPKQSSSEDGKDGENGGDETKEFRIVNDDTSANLTGKDIRAMLEYGWYHVKIQSEDDAGSFVFQTVPACNLRRANFKDQFDITLPRSSAGDRQDPMTSFAYTPLVSPLARKDCEDYNDGDNNEDTVRLFSSRVSVQLDTPAMTIKTILPQSKPPPGIAFVKQSQTPGQQRGSTSGADDGDNYEDPDAPPTPPSPLGFFSKYWYIILPMIILQVLQAPEEP